MPWKPEQRRAIAARMSREGKSREEISRFFRKHGHVGSDHPMMKAVRKRKR